MTLIGADGPVPAYLNGQFMPLDDVKIPVLDRGFIFGDGIYEVIPLYDRVPFLLDRHLARLQRSLGRVRIEAGFDVHGWVDLIDGLIARFQGHDGMVYLQVTRGVAPRAHGFPPASVKPTIFAMLNAAEFPDAALRDKGLSAVKKEDERWMMCDIKSTSLLGNVLAKQYAIDHQADEVFQFRDGFLTEGASSNVWVVKGGVLMRPIADSRILEGIRYSFIAQLAAQSGVELATRNLTEAEVDAADELMVSSATKEILPVTHYAGRAVGNGQPGPVYRRLRQAYDRAIQGAAARHAAASGAS